MQGSDIELRTSEHRTSWEAEWLEALGLADTLPGPGPYGKAKPQKRMDHKQGRCIFLMMTVRRQGLYTLEPVALSCATAVVTRDCSL